MLEKIRSFAVEKARLYVCYIPTINEFDGVTYVFDAYVRKWTKWYLPFSCSHVDKNGNVGIMTYAPSFVGNTIQSDGKYMFRYNSFNDNYYDLNAVANNQTQNTLNSTTRTLTNTGITVPNNIQGVVNVKFHPNNLVYHLSVLNSQSFWSTPGNSMPGQSILSGFPSNVKLSLGSTNRTINVEYETTGFSNLTIDSIRKGIDSYVEFQPFTAGNPNGLKQFSEFHVHTDGEHHRIYVKFKTDSRSTYTNNRVFTEFAQNRTVFRTYIPVEAARGRWLIRGIGHDYAGEAMRLIGQDIIFRDMGTTRNQKQQ
jgi:hypothetical protein